MLFWVVTTEGKNHENGKNASHMACAGTVCNNSSGGKSNA
jgi:hypothetical protein